MTDIDEKDLKSHLDPLQYAVCWNKATEPAFSGKYNSHYENGIYTCVACDAPLFESSSKYDSGSGWPSFFSPVNDKAITELNDISHGMVRVEVVCSSCKAHLGHVFEDGPKPTGLRYCINSASLNFYKS